MSLVIESIQNPKVKQVLRWREKPASRRKEGLCLVEGAREVERALLSGWELTACFEREGVDFGHPGMRMRPLACQAEVFEKMVVRQRGVDVLGIFRTPQRTLADLTFPANPLILVLDGVEKPGNLGAILRTADAAGVDAVVLSSVQCDAYSPESIRNSLGGIFHVPLVDATRTEVQMWLDRNKIPVYQLHLQGSSSPYATDLTGSVAIVLGAEDTGLDGSWNMLPGGRLKLPMAGVVDSLNVSVTAGVILYEVLRQRGR
ncbi:MAG TPA: rRNA methyltransferase [Cryomorphaceae bacterium]|jgi:TrmH family RNA methyltransferase|nr:rRNA methyltransferase [Cryomorphaceae bacterium]HBJ71498.1 rRNA methyltransferase [Cryomorphaceae bacterium]